MPSWRNDEPTDADRRRLFVQTEIEAEAGDPQAEVSLGCMYSFGLGTRQDFGKALFWWKRAADKGDACGQRNLGQLYEEGNGVPVDKIEALKWYLLAALGNNPVGVEDRNRLWQALSPAETAEAQNRASRWQKNVPELLAWLEKAAHKGVVSCQIRLGGMYESGEGVKQDYVTALQWYLVGSAGTFDVHLEAQKRRDSLLKKMTPSQIDRAKRLAVEKAATINGPK